MNLADNSDATPPQPHQKAKTLTFGETLAMLMAVAESRQQIDVRPTMRTHEVPLDGPIGVPGGAGKSE